ncbi:MAG: DHH family phosphoesterase [Microgenomates group bacterium]|nr:DHH family phosphoesterase [Microgenomates group bacterium]
MFPNNNSLLKIADIINKGNSGAIVLNQNPTVDSVAAATALYLFLTKIGKNISLVCSQPVNNNLFGSDKIQTDLTVSGNNLVISFPYVEGSIDKVDYNIQGNFFNLIITPRAGQPKLDPNQVKFLYSGGTLDFIITIDASSLTDLGEIYSNYQNEFQGKNIINIDRHFNNSFFGTVNFVNKTSSSTSEMVFKIIRSLNGQLDSQIATNLYAGLVAATNNFSSYSVNPETFQTAAELLKLGAQKKTAKAPSQPLGTDSSLKQSINFNKPQANKSIGDVEKEPSIKEKPAPQDWLKPKIFKGGGLI